MNARISRHRRAVRQAAGFTLLEVMLVIGLLALLAALVIPALQGRSEKAKIGLAQSQIGPSSSMSQAIQQFKMDTGKWPQDLKDLVEKPTDEALAKGWAGPYLQEVGKDPWDNEFQYAGGENAKHNKDRIGFDLWSNGPDGVADTEDDIGNWKKDN